MAAGRKVPDPGPLRARRSRLHRAGDHSLCRDPSRCRALRLAAVSPVSAPPGTAEDAVLAFAAEARFGPEDARAKVVALAARLAALADADPANMVIARELTKILFWLAERPAEELDGIDQIKARRYARTAIRLIEERQQ